MARSRIQQALLACCHRSTTTEVVQFLGAAISSKPPQMRCKGQLRRQLGTSQIWVHRIHSLRLEWMEWRTPDLLLVAISTIISRTRARTET